MKKILSLFFFSTSICTSVGAVEFKHDPAPMYLNLPLAEAPYNYANGFRVPGMTQSMKLSNSTEYAVHSFIDYTLSPLPWSLQGIGLFFGEYFLTYIPGGTGWGHEEWHRAVMGQYGINSFDDIYNMKIGASTVSVSHEKDSDLVWLKAHHNDDMVRLMEAGNEANIEQTKIMRRDDFFSGRSPEHDRIGWILSLVNVTMYIQTCTTSEADTMTDDMNKKETTISERDFTGLDFTAWIYDLNRPNEPYSARGMHQSGTGYDRYIKKSDLTDSEKKYLSRTWKMSLLNFVSPQLFGFSNFQLPMMNGKVVYANGFLYHHLTSFGWDAGMDLFFMYGDHKIEWILHGYSNKKVLLPGIECSIVREEVELFNNKVYVTARAMGYLQPKDGLFHTTKSVPGGLLGAGIAYPLTSWCEVYAEVSAKSYGWIAGSVRLRPSVEANSGMTFVLR
jgi:hypothetical protein